jgi:hypothetical protein
VHRPATAFFHAAILAVGRVKKVVSKLEKTECLFHLQEFASLLLEKNGVLNSDDPQSRV